MTHFEKVVAAGRDALKVAPVLTDALKSYENDFSGLSEYVVLKEHTPEALRELALDLPGVLLAVNEQQREIAAIISTLELNQVVAGQVVRVALLNPKDGKAPAATVLEKAVDADPLVLQWATLIIPMKLMQDRFAGLAKSLDWMNSQIKALVGAQQVFS